MKTDVGYNLNSDIKKEISKVKDTCIDILNNAEIYLFGSISKGMYKVNSDIDILILIDGNNSLKELRDLRHLLEDEIDKVKLSRNVDIKLYNKNRYFELAKEISFEQAIKENLIDIRMW